MDFWSRFADFAIIIQVVVAFCCFVAVAFLIYQLIRKG